MPDQILARLGLLHPKVIDLSLGRVERLLATLGNPERKLAPVIHIAGTNGKGSVLAYLRAVLEASGKRVHAYTSPHLVRFNERIRINGRLIDDAHLASLLTRCEQANGGQPITFFEITTAAAFLAFAEEPADVVLLETGLGGRLDATNMIEQPALTIITPVSIDHVQFLGNDVDSIAFEKAGILKRRVPGIIGLQKPGALDVIARRAAELDAPLLVQGRDFEASAVEGKLHWYGKSGAAMLPDIKDLPTPALPGWHQIGNAGLAIAAALSLPAFLRPKREAIATGLTGVEWRARLQRLTSGPLVDALPPGCELWLDGGHNEAAGEVIADWIAARPGPVDLIAGMLNSKLAADFFRPSARLVRHACTIAIPDSANSYSAEELANIARITGYSVATAASLTDALQHLLLQAGEKPPAVILIAGSLYLAGHVLANHR